MKTPQIIKSPIQTPSGLGDEPGPPSRRTGPPFAPRAGTLLQVLLRSIFPCGKIRTVLIWASLGSVVSAEVVKSAGDLTGPWQLFVDDYCIADMNGLARRYYTFTKDPRNPFGYQRGPRGTTFPGEDGRGYRRWTQHSLHTSPDGVTWTAVPYVRDYPNQLGDCAVIYTPGDQGREYKMFAGHSSGETDRRYKYGRYGFYSSDGVHWTALETNPLLLVDGDTGMFNWDPLARRYIGTPKLWAYTRGYFRRSVGFTSSDRFETGWAKPELILVPDEFDDRWVTQPGQRTEFYHLSAFAYESMYLGLLEIFWNTDGWKDGYRFVELVTSRDGRRWHRTQGDRTPILPLGPAGTWDSGMLSVPNHPLVEGDTIKLFYKGSDVSHGFSRKEYASFGGTYDSQLGIATLRKDGFASLEAGKETGSVTTVPLHGAAGVLAVNYRAAGGWLKAEILDGTGRPLPGFGLGDCTALTGDSVNATVAWGARRELPAAGPIRIRFAMQNASLYSFNAGPGLRLAGKEPDLQVLYTFEGDSDWSATDRLREDGAQGLYFLNAVVVDNDGTAAGQQANAAFGNSEVMFLKDGEHARMLRARTSYQGKSGLPSGLTWSVLEIEGTHQLGNRFTLAAMIQVENGHQARLFSSWEPPVAGPAPYERDGWIEPNELAFDFDASGRSPFGCLRIAVHGREITAPGSFADGRYHHLAATYDDGMVRLYLDGREVGRGQVPGGAVALLSNLHVGGNPAPRFGQAAPPAGGQLEGQVDDVLVLGRVLTPAEIMTAAEKGAQSLFGLSTPGK